MWDLDAIHHPASTTLSVPLDGRFHQAEVRKLLRNPRRLSLHATAADRVVIESYKGKETHPRGMLLVRVVGAEVVEVKVYGPTSA